MLLSPIKNPIQPVLRSPIKGLIAAIRRSFIQFRSAAQQHIKLSEDIVLSGDFEIELIYAGDELSGAFLGSAGSFIRLGSGYQYMIGGTYYNTGVLFRENGVFTIFRLVRRGNVAKIYQEEIEVDSRSVVGLDFIISNIGSRGSSNFYGGYLANIRIWSGGDRKTGALEAEYLLDESLSQNFVRSTNSSLGSELYLLGGLNLVNGSTGGFTNLGSQKTVLISKPEAVEFTINGSWSGLGHAEFLATTQYITFRNTSAEPESFIPSIREVSGYGSTINLTESSVQLIEEEL